MVFRRRVVREVPEAIQDGLEVAEVLRARRIIEGYAAKWRGLYHRLLLDVYQDQNIPPEDKHFVVRTIIEGVSRAVRGGALLSASRAVNASVAELLKDIAAVLEGKKRVVVEKAAELAATRGEIGEEALEQLFNTLKAIGLQLYKEIQADRNITDKRENWRVGYLAFVDLITSGGAPALELIMSKYAHVLAKAFKLALEQAEYTPEELIAGD